MTTRPRTLAELRSDLPITGTYAYLQTGSYAPLPLSTQAYMAALQREENEVALAAGGKGQKTPFYERAEQARRTLATLLGVTPAEVAWTYNTTTATRLAVHSVQWRAGDRLALSDVEHASTFQLARGMKQLLGVETTVVSSERDGVYDPGYFLDQLDLLLTPEHRLLILCHVANTDGRRLPVAQAVQIAAAHGVKTLIDGAQAVGVFPVDVGRIGAAFYSGSLHKWLLGPAGVGFLAVKQDQLADYNPNFVPLPLDDGHTLSAGVLSELGTANHVQRMGAAYSIETLQEIGLGVTEAHMRTLTERLRVGLRALPGIVQLTPDAWTDSSSITTIRPARSTNEKCQALVAMLRKEFGIITKVRPEVLGVRISAAPFNTEQEIDRLLEALASARNL